ncbi:MAG TPA: PrsW family intramembrane metalloprotease, partial [Pyrinomonadaceae bacterium]|nr:PrsW family intramembrane metalloprotease [Pyrinomonadaceae bacterium]
MLNNPQMPGLDNSNITPIRIQKSGHMIAIKVVAAIAAILIALLLGLIVFLLIGFETGPVGLMIGLVSATIPVPLYILLVLWVDRYESEPLSMLAMAFFWGALVAVFFALVLNTASGVIVAGLTDDRTGEAFSAGISAPIVEESAKAIILLLFFFLRKDEFDGVVDGIVYAAMAGLGFAMTENIQYYGRAVLQGSGGGLTLVFIIRGMLAPFSHPLFTAMTGMGLGLARQSRNTFIKIVAPVLGLGLAIFLHSVWNGSAIVFGFLGFILIYVLIMVPTFFIVLAVIFVSLRREGRVVRDFLLADYQRGMLSPEEYNQLCSVRGRMGASFNALSRGGITHWRTSMRFNQTAS